MKTLFLLPVFFLSSFLVLSQPVLTGANFNPVPGDTFVIYYCNNNCGSTVSNPGAGGPNVVWNFSNLVAKDSATNAYELCSSTPYCAKVPGSNIAAVSISSGGGFTYFKADSTKYEELSSFYSIDTVRCNGNILMQFPFTYTDSFDVNFHYSTRPDTENAYDMKRVLCDAYGTLILPNDTIYNVLRIHYTDSLIDTVISNGVMTIKHGMQHLYWWQTPGYHNYLLAIIYVKTGSASDTIYNFTTPHIPHSNTYIKASPGIMENNIRLWPNPATDILYTDAKDDATMFVKSLVGATLLSGNAKQMDISKLPAGIYVVQVLSKEGLLLKNGKLLKL